MEHRYNKEGYIVLEESFPGALETQMMIWRMDSELHPVKKHKTKKESSTPDFFFTSDDYEPGQFKFNIGDHIEMVRPAGEEHKKFRLRDLFPKILGSTFEFGKDGMEFRIYYE